ncbi:conserved hypothetical protein [Hyphomicrobiales bacterium]|jgi:hypothetical protein|nr:conserved hypothetical protein [Hyphomicrobiales bacterium]CAH1702224.1 hypothetical protein BOSEA1005_30096 [Hyphomicrobiales bacterium]CAI0346427.1 conserved hypothetical protein [Hyphomicrobiales bacterium]
MRIQFASTAHAGHLAKALKRELASINPKLSDAQNAIGRMMGYRNWQELTANSTPAHSPSPFDDQVDEAERAARRLHQIKALVSSFRLDEASATTIVDKLKPTGFRPSAVPRRPEEWKRLLAEMVEKPGLAGFPAGEPTSFDPEWDKPKRYDIGDGEVIEMISHEVEGWPFSIRSIVCTKRIDGRLAIYGRGYVVKLLRKEALDGDFEWAFFDACDQVEDDLAEAANALKPVCDVAFDRGSLFVLQFLTRDHAITTKGEGMSFLARSLGFYAKEIARRRFSLIAAEPTAMQFDHRDYNKLRAMPQHEKAFRKLFEWFMGHPALEALTGEYGAMSYDAGRGTEGADVGLALAGKNMFEGDGDRDTTEMDRVIRNTIVRSRIPFRENWQDEVDLLKPDDFPPEFDIGVAGQFKQVSPHPDLWKHLPSDVTRLKIVPSEEDELSAVGMRPALVLHFAFANGTELSVPSSFTAFGRDMTRVLPQLKTEADTLVGFTSPYTDKMATTSLQCVLGVNALMAFTGREEVPASRLTAPIEITRPELLPKAV